MRVKRSHFQEWRGRWQRGGAWVNGDEQGAVGRGRGREGERGGDGEAGDGKGETERGQKVSLVDVV